MCVLKSSTIFAYSSAMVKQDLAELQALKEKIVEARGRAARDAWNIGVHLARIRREELWRAGGYESFTDFLIRGIQCP